MTWDQGSNYNACTLCNRQNILWAMQPPYFLMIVAKCFRKFSRTYSSCIEEILTGLQDILVQTEAYQLRSMTEFIQEHHLSFGVLINQADRTESLTKNIIQLPAG